MAELNFGLLNPPGSQSFGNAFVQGMDQAAAARAQENQNALAQYQLSAARRSDQTQNSINRAYQESIGSEGQIDYPKLQSRLAAGGAGSAIPKLQSERATAENLAARTAASKATTDKTNYEIKRDKNKQAILEVAGFPDAESAGAAIDARLLNNIIDQSMADQMRQGLTQENFTKWKHNTLIRLSTPAEQLRQSALSHVDTPRGNYTGRQYFDAQGKPVGPEERLSIGVSPNTTATIQAARQNHLENLAQQGWTFDTERGIAVNARLGISKPISTLMLQVGGPTAAPVVSAPVSSAPAVPGVVPMAASTGVPGQRQATASQAPASQPVTAPNVLAPKPEKAPAEFTKMDNQLSNLVGNLNRFKQEIAKGKTTSAQWAPTGADTAAMNAKYISLLMGMKDMYTLGALTGPDLGLIEAQISNPATWGGFTKSREAFNAQIDNVEQQLKDASLNLENSYGHKPKATSAAFSRNPAASKDAPPPPPIDSFRPSREKP